MGVAGSGRLGVGVGMVVDKLGPFVRGSLVGFWRLPFVFPLWCAGPMPCERPVFLSGEPQLASFRGGAVMASIVILGPEVVQPIWFHGGPWGFSLSGVCWDGDPLPLHVIVSWLLVTSPDYGYEMLFFQGMYPAPKCKSGFS